MPAIKIRNNCVFLRDPIDVLVNDVPFSVERRQSVSLDIDQHIVSVKVEQYWLSAESIIDIDADEADLSVVIHERVPGVVFFSAAGLMLALYALYAFSVIGHVVPTLYTLIAVFAIMANVVFFRKSYFRITGTYIKPEAE